MNLRKKARKGYSLLEIIIVLSILAIFSTFAVLSYSTYRHHVRISNSAQEILSTLSTARTFAINQNSYFEVVIDISGQQFWINEVNSSRRTIRPKIVSPKSLNEFVRVTDVKVNALRRLAGEARILFRPNSTSDQASIHLLRQNDDPGIEENYYTIKLYASTAQSHILPNAKR
jgi:prepilin-type N-terminal cleavage/methylation domain-containing protein